MPGTNSFDSAILATLFENANLANVGDAAGIRGSATAGVFYVSLHTSSPGKAGDQTTNEANYGAYARASVPRDVLNWSVSAGVVSNLLVILFPQCTSGSSDVSYFGIGSDLAGAGHLFMYGALTGTFSITPTVTPEFLAGTLTTSQD